MEQEGSVVTRLRLAQVANASSGCAAEAALMSEAIELIERRGRLDELVQKIERWGADRKILAHSTGLAQFQKTLEEVDELREGLETNDREEIEDAIGDVVVTLVMVAGCTGMNFTDCVESAYNTIKDRKGVLLPNGIFQKHD